MGFIPHYVFPDGELHEIGTVVTRVQHAGFEVRHCETLQEHYAVTLRAWVQNLERHYDEAVAPVGEDAPASGVCTWRGQRWDSRPATSRCTRCSLSGRMEGAAVCRCDRTELR